ncbi:hypothetical protein ACA910_018920 [Epithemia clementina (nom. ined.)]
MAAVKKKDKPIWKMKTNHLVVVLRILVLLGLSSWFGLWIWGLHYPSSSSGNNKATFNHTKEGAELEHHPLLPCTTPSKQEKGDQEGLQQQQQQQQDSLSTLAAAREMARILDLRQPPFFIEHALPASGATIIVVLGFGKPTQQRQTSLSDKALHHVKVAVDLALTTNDSFLLFTGGYGEGILMAAKALELWFLLTNTTTTNHNHSHLMPVFTETASRTTTENALNTKVMLDHHPIFVNQQPPQHLHIIVVASDWHLPRALLNFRAVFLLGHPQNDDHHSSRYTVQGHAVKWHLDPKGPKLADQQSGYVQDNADLLRELGFVDHVAKDDIQQAIRDVRAAALDY